MQLVELSWFSHNQHGRRVIRSSLVFREQGRVSLCLSLWKYLSMLAFHLRDLVQHVELHPVRLKQLQDTTYHHIHKYTMFLIQCRTVCWKRTIGLYSSGLICVSFKAEETT